MPSRTCRTTERSALRPPDHLSTLDTEFVLGDPATGLWPRTLPGQDNLTGVHVLRTLDDAIALRADLLTCQRVVVVGDGVLGAAVTGLAGEGRVTGVTLATGEVLPTDVVVVAFGAAPATEWMADSGLTCDNG